jgi:hypothetical protein
VPNHLGQRRHRADLEPAVDLPDSTQLLDLAEIDDDISGLEKARNTIDATIGAASKVLDRASSEVAIQTAKAEFSEELATDHVGHVKLRKLC